MASSRGQIQKDDHIESIKEGLAYILVPQQASASQTTKQKPTSGVAAPQSVFYNPIQQFNRDLTVLAIRAYGEDLIASRKAKAEKSFARRSRKNEASGPRGTKRKADVLNEQPSEEIQAEIVKATTDGALNEAANGRVTDAEPEAATSKATKEENSAIDNEEVEQSNGTREKKMEFKVLDALSATGLRALRFAKEIPFATSVTANDVSPQATASIRKNVEYNKLQETVKVNTGNALSYMYSLTGVPTTESGGKYDVVDLDPYGTATPFLDAALQALKNGGLLCATFTDSGVWASCGYPERTYSLYGGIPIKGLHSHEGGLRLILHAIASAGAKYGIAIEPLMSLSVDFYARVFVRITKSPSEVKFLAGKTMLVYCCDSGCGAWSTQFIARHQQMQAKDGTTFYKNSLAQGPPSSPRCEHCGMKTHMSGPMYGGPLHNPAFLEAILASLPSLDREVYATTDRIEGMLHNAIEEAAFAEDTGSFVNLEANEAQHRTVPPMNPAAVDKHPFFFNTSALAKVVRAVAPSEAAIKGALKHAGFNVSRSHTKPGAIKTNAPWSFIWEMMREWVRQKAPIKEGAVKPGTAGAVILQLHKSENGSKVDVDGSGEKNVGKEVNPSNEDVGLSSKDVESSGKEVELSGQEAESSSKTRSIVFDEKLGSERRARKLVRYQLNPPNWGPMNRARGGAAP